MNNQLLKLYSSKWENLNSKIKEILEDENLEIKPTNPLLLYLDESKFNDADIRIMIFGQETNDWGGEMNIESKVEDRLEGYNDFFNSEHCFAYGGQFWNGVSRFVNLIRQKYPQKKVSLVWNNIVKIGKEGDKGFPPDYIYEIERNYFSVINEEIEIIKPNLVLFLTGPNYDSVLVDNFGSIKFHAVAPYPERQISKISISNVPFAFRTYHPNYLWRNDINDYFNSIIEQTNFN